MTAPTLPAVEDVDALPLNSLPAFLAGCAALQARAAARIAAREITSAGQPIADRKDVGERLLTIPEVAERLRVPRQHAYELARRELPAVRFGKYVRIRAADLDAWVARRREAP